MRVFVVVGLVIGLISFSSEPAHGDCTGGPVFGQTVLAQDQNTLSWGTAADIDFVKGSLAGLPTYTSWVRGSLVQATGLDTSNDNPPPGEGVFYLVKPSGPPCGSWQSSPGAEPARDAEIQPPCSLVAPTDEQIEAAIDAGLEAAPNPWGDQGDARRFFEYTQDALGCTFEAFEATEGLNSLAADPPQWNPAEFYCGLDFPNSFVAFAIEWPAGPCLNLACFNHDACYFSNCVGGGCAFSPQTVNTGCDTPLILDACGASGCLQQDGFLWYFANKFICTVAIASVTAQQSNLFCQDPSCSDPGEVCVALSGSCCGPPVAETCDNQDNNCDGATDENLGSTTCGVGACQVTVANCVGGMTQTCTPGTPTVELCDNVDNDCDGAVDGFATTCGLGVCAAVGTCTNGADSCTRGTPSSEVCDGLDNDCDGQIDEGGDALCSDGNACTGVETCQGSARCQAGTPLNCSDKDPCTADSCDSATGQCVSSPIPSCSTYYFQDFEGAVGSEWSVGEFVSVTPIGSRRFLGEFWNTSVSLALPSLPSHTAIALSFDLFIIRSWDGNGEGCCGPDIVNVYLDDGRQLLHTTFSNGIHNPELWVQAYPGSYPEGRYPPQTGAVEKNSLGFTYDGTPLDAVYHIEASIPHSTDSVRFNFWATGLEASVSDESWGLDNVSVGLVDSGGVVTQPGNSTPPPRFFEAGTQRVEFDEALPGGGFPPGLRLDAGIVISTASWGTLTDYAQDSPVSDLFTLSLPHHLTITFDESVLGGLPTAVGLVFTDSIASGCNVTLRAWSGANRSGTLLASVTAFRGNDGTNDTNFGDDSFFGIRGVGRIGSVDMTSDASSGGLEADVLYYGSLR